jgi:hypothetical protein
LPNAEQLVSEAPELVRMPYCAVLLDAVQLMSEGPALAKMPELPMLL